MTASTSGSTTQPRAAIRGYTDRNGRDVPAHSRGYRPARDTFRSYGRTMATGIAEIGVLALGAVIYALQFVTTVLSAAVLLAGVVVSSLAVAYVTPPGRQVVQRARASAAQATNAKRASSAAKAASSSTKATPASRAQGSAQGVRKPAKPANSPSPVRLSARTVRDAKALTRWQRKVARRDARRAATAGWIARWRARHREAAAWRELELSRAARQAVRRLRARTPVDGPRLRAVRQFAQGAPLAEVRDQWRATSDRQDLRGYDQGRDAA